ncbi:Hypothetical protein MROS_0399 [Melioribacter roseus P3M-2]|uniref:DUF58 domain-containing protein n=1 Tax=Melioribacter roseus (strain DSM 23840 / JCM 17771 / VKM B-2668 / P3M-2) TaxID=1191523 RepID=I6YSW7_MELRP|nr:DUF58 domain-containing protein [Melioribacter roseus]AFN73642.1 Hypothetical protein MROS_0399 [Melioribacter roseus P3M-2]
MIAKDLIKQVRHIEIRTRGLVNELFSGEYHSVFKGRGMEFAEVREYQIGDDIRNIDWNVTARFGHPYVKVFEEERELTVILMVDMSGSLLFGSGEKNKQRIAAELSAILAFSALKNNDKVGLILFTDQIEKFIPPKKGKTHSLRLIREVLSFEPQGNRTNIKQALEYLNHAVKKRAIVFLISDFLDEGYDKMLRIVGKKHDLVGIVLNDRRERELNGFGLIKFHDPETGDIRYVDTNGRDFEVNYAETIRRLNEYRKSIFISGGIDSVEIDTSQTYVKPLVEFFKMREKRW